MITLLLFSLHAHAAGQVFVLTGGPGAGKTAIAIGLERRGERVVREAATDLIHHHQARGVARPWLDPNYQVEMAELQRLREARLTPGERAFLDRTALDCLAYCAIEHRAPRPELTAVIDAIGFAHYAPLVFVIAGSGEVERTRYRMETPEEAAAIEAALRRVYAERGFTLVDVPWDEVDRRVDFVLAHARRFACGERLGGGRQVDHDEGTSDRQ